jgi:hypothetical protein
MRVFQSRINAGIKPKMVYSHAKGKEWEATACALWVFDDRDYDNKEMYKTGLGFTLLGNRAFAAHISQIHALDTNWASFEWGPFHVNNVNCWDTETSGDAAACKWRMDTALRGFYDYRGKILAVLRLFTNPNHPSPGNVLYDEPFFKEGLADFKNADFTAELPGKKRFDQPYYNQRWIDYKPPQLHDARIVGTSIGVQMYWSDKIWPDLSYTWDDWGQFSHFEIFENNKFFAESQSNIYSGRAFDMKSQYTVAAVSKAGKKGRPVRVAASSPLT